MKILKGIVIVMAVLFVAAQLVRPPRINPPFDESETIYATGNVPSDVRAILERSCADCHSHMTRWPWYSNLAPVSWLVAQDVKEAREELNFSKWADYPPERAEHKLEEICEMVGDGEMPLRTYVFTHEEAALSGTDRSRLCEWSSAWRAEILR